jgi:hypothetical protein
VRRPRHRPFWRHRLFTSEEHLLGADDSLARVEVPDDDLHGGVAGIGLHLVELADTVRLRSPPARKASNRAAGGESPGCSTLSLACA